MLTTEKDIERVVKSTKKGQLLFPEDFTMYGSQDAIRKALQRLREKGLLRRVAQGIYVRPQHNDLFGEITPTAEQIAQGIARRDKATIIPAGAYAENVLGLSTQVPLNVVYLTSGSSRKVVLKNRTIKFKYATPKNFAFKGQISQLVVQALKHIGKDRVSDEQIKKVLQQLKKEDQNKLKQDIKLAPEWIRVIMRKAIKPSESGK